MSFTQKAAYLALFFLSLLVGLPQTGTAQSAWTNPFETPEEQQDEDRNAWTTDDPWNTDDPWGIKERDRSWGQSDWARDFYDSDDENSGSGSGSARRVGDGPMMMASGCTDCNGNGQTCCLVDDGNGVTVAECQNGNSCGQGNGNNSGQIPEDDCGNIDSNDPNADKCTDQCATDPTLDACQDYCQANPNDPDCTNVDIVPLPGLVYLLLAGLGYGGYRLRDRHTA